MNKIVKLFILLILIFKAFIFPDKSFSQDMLQWDQASEVGIHYLTKINGVYTRNLEYNGAKVIVSLFINENGESKLSFSEKIPLMPTVIYGRNRINNGKLYISFTNGMSIQAESITIVLRSRNEIKPRVFTKLYLSPLSTTDTTPVYLLGDYKAASGSQSYNPDLLKKGFIYQFARFSNQVPSEAASSLNDSSEKTAPHTPVKLPENNYIKIEPDLKNQITNLQSLQEENNRLQNEIDNIKSEIDYAKQKNFVRSSKDTLDSKVINRNRDLKKNYNVIFFCSDQHGMGHDYLQAKILINLADIPQTLQAAASSSKICYLRSDPINGAKILGRSELVFSRGEVDYLLFQDGSMTFGIIARY